MCATTAVRHATLFSLLLASCAGEVERRAPIDPCATCADAGEDMIAAGDMPSAVDMMPPADMSPPADMRPSADMMDMAAPPPYDAKMLNKKLPTMMTCGTTTVGEITLENTGSVTWSRALAVRLRSIHDNPLSTSNRTQLGETDQITPGSSYTFTFQITAPSTAGDHVARWQLASAEAGLFGPIVEANVSVTCPMDAEPPPPDLSTVIWLHTDVSSWAQTATLDAVTVQSGRICMPYDRADTWPSRDPFNNGVEVVANPWIFIHDQNSKKWYGATWEWLRPGQTCKNTTSVAGDHIKRAPFDAASGWTPTSGEVYYFMISALARTGAISVQERSNLVRVVWP